VALGSDSAQTPTAVRDPSVVTFAFRIFLASLTMIFGATLVAFAIVRNSNDVWRTPDMPALPLGLVACTVLLGGISWSLERALARYRRNDLSGAQMELKMAAVFAVGFLAGQALNWQQMLVPVTTARTLYPFTFYMLTGTHALHVLGGLVPLGVVLWRTSRGDYSSSRHQGVMLCAQYWHYLGAVWLVLLAALFWGTA